MVRNITRISQKIKKKVFKYRKKYYKVKLNTLLQL